MSRYRKLLIITGKHDTHADYIINLLRQMGMNDYIVRLNTEDFLDNVEIVFRDGEFLMHIKDSGRSFDNADIGCVWYRKPEEVIIPDECDEESRTYIEGSVHSVLQGIYHILAEPAIWINPRQTAQNGGNKLRQLQVARSIGFLTPRTIVTNSIVEARRFLTDVGDVCTKDFDTTGRTAIRTHPAFTTRLTRHEALESVDLVSVAPTMFQEYIPKKFDLRVTVIGGAIYAVEIHSQEISDSIPDFRIVDPSRIPHKPHALPASMKTRICEYMARFDLVYSALDFAVTVGGEYYFLENNPNGQWLWQELLCDAPISEGFVRLFLDAMNPNAV